MHARTGAPLLAPASWPHPGPSWLPVPAVPEGAQLCATVIPQSRHPIVLTQQRSATPCTPPSDHCPSTALVTAACPRGCSGAPCRCGRCCRWDEPQLPPNRHHRRAAAAAASHTCPSALWLQGVLLVMNGLAVISNERFLEPSECGASRCPSCRPRCRAAPAHVLSPPQPASLAPPCRQLGFSQLGNNPMGPSPNALKYQVIGTLHAAAYMRGEAMGSTPRGAGPCCRRVLRACDGRQLLCCWCSKHPATLGAERLGLPGIGQRMPPACPPLPLMLPSPDSAGRPAASWPPPAAVPLIAINTVVIMCAGGTADSGWEGTCMRASCMVPLCACPESCPAAAPPPPAPRSVKLLFG